jgi:hypothetical protein
VRAATFLLGVVFGCGGCESPVAPSWTVEGVQEIEAPAWAADLFHEVEDCMGQPGDFRALRFYSATWIEVEGQAAEGGFLPPSSIFVHDRSFEDHPVRILRHEFVHALGGGHGPEMEDCGR